MTFYKINPNALHLVSVPHFLFGYSSKSSRRIQQINRILHTASVYISLAMLHFLSQDLFIRINLTSVIPKILRGRMLSFCLKFEYSANENCVFYTQSWEVLYQINNVMEDLNYQFGKLDINLVPLSSSSLSVTPSNLMFSFSNAQ